MKKDTFRNYFAALLVADLLAAGLMFADYGAIVYLFAGVVLALVLAPFFLYLKKTADESKKEKIRRAILVVMLIPVGIAAVAVVCVVVSMLFYFA